MLLKVIIENDAKRIQKVLSKKRGKSESNQRQEQFRTIFSDHLVDDLLRHRRKDHDHAPPRDALARNGAAVVFNSGEESLYQLRMTSQRLGLLCHFVASNEIHVPTLLSNCTKMRNSAKYKGKPFFLILDSLQCMDDGHYPDGATNSKTPERVLQMVTEYAKEHYINPVVIGQVTKGGKFAGTNTLKHMVDTHAHLSIEVKDPDLAGLRILEVEKNRYGGAGSRQFLAMTETGFTLVASA